MEPKVRLKRLCVFRYFASNCYCLRIGLGEELLVGTDDSDVVRKMLKVPTIAAGETDERLARSAHRQLPSGSGEDERSVDGSAEGMHLDLE